MAGDEEKYKELFSMINEQKNGGLAINQVHCGDCLILMKEIPDKSVDMILADPPY
jgi:DNA modification methylase